MTQPVPKKDLFEEARRTPSGAEAAGQEEARRTPGRTQGGGGGYDRSVPTQGQPEGAGGGRDQGTPALKELFTGKQEIKGFATPQGRSISWEEWRKRKSPPMAPRAFDDQLPIGAVGRDDKGRPYYGGSSPIGDWAKGAAARWFAPVGERPELGEGVFDEKDWDWKFDLKTAGYVLGELTQFGENVADNLRNLGVVPGEDPGIATYLGRAAAEILPFAGAGFETIGDVTGQLANVGLGLAERGAMQNIDSPLPDLVRDDQLSWMDQTPIGWAYNATRALVSRQPNKYQQMRTDWQTGRLLWTEVWKEGAEAIIESDTLGGTGFSRWVAAHSLFERALENGVRAEAKQRIMAGENPYLVSLNLENPVAQMVGEIITDPLNVVGLLSKAGKLKTTLALTKADLIDPAADIAKVVGKGTLGEMSALRALDELAEASYTADKVIQEGITAGRQVKSSWSTLWGLREPTMAARKARVMKRNNEFLQVMVHNLPGKRENPDLFHEVFKALLETTSDEAMERVTGWQTLTTMAKRGDITSVQPFMSTAGRETALFMKEMAGEDPLSFLKLLKGQDTAEGAARAAEIFDKKFQQTLDKIYPDLIDRVNAAKKAGKIDDIPAHLQAAARFHAFTRPTYNAVNGIFAGVYMGLNPGYAVRNYLNDAATIWTDLGLKTVVSNPMNAQSFADRAATWLGGRVPEAAKRAIGGVHAGEAATEKAKWWQPGIKAANQFELSNSQRVVGKAVDDAMNQLLSKGLDTQPLVRAGFSQRDAQAIARSVINKKGDVSAAFEAFRKEAKLGVANRFRDGSWVSTKNYQILRDHGMLDPFLKILDEAESVDDFRRRAKAELGDVWDAIAKSSDQIDPRITPEHGSVQYMDLINQGLTMGVTDEDVALFQTGYHQVNYNARATMQAALEEARQSLLYASNGDPELYNQIMQEVVHVTAAGKEFTAGDLFKTGTLDRAYGDYLSAMGGQMNLVDSYLQDFPNNLEGMKLAWSRKGWGDFPPGVTNKIEFKAAAWDKYFQNSKLLNIEWRKAYEGAGQIALGRMIESGAQVSPSIIDDVIHNFDVARMWDELNDTRELRFSISRAVKGKNNRQAIYDLAEIFDLPELKLGATARTTRQKDPAILNVINKWAEDMKGVGPFDSIDDIPPNVAEQIFGFRKFGENWHLPDAPRPTAQMIAHSSDAMPIGTQMFKSTNGGFQRWLGELVEEGAQHFDDAVPLSSDPGLLKALDEAEKVWSENVATSRIVANQYATAVRDFILHDYSDRTGLDMALSYVYPYHFWYSRTYNNWLSPTNGRITSSPEVISRYFKYRMTMEKIHADLPEWWRYNVNSNELFGLNMENPLFFNLEASLNPMKGLLETDFNDPARRVNWWTSVLDGIDNFGPTTWTPIQMITAYGLMLQGEDEAAARWGGRLIPQTKQIRDVTALLNIGSGAGVELDPFVHLFSGGLGPYERRRVGRVLSEMVSSGQISEEQALEVARTQSGEIWDAAVAAEADKRAPGNLSGFMFGVGFKARSQEDMQIDIFYDDYYKLMDRWDDLTPREIRDSFDWLRSQYPFMDTLMLSRKVGVERDRAYAYNVLGRIPPGQKDDIFKMFNLDPDLYSTFYENKGDLSKLDAGERDDLMDLVVDLGAILEMPDTATKSEWSAARDAYDRMQSEQQQLFGEDIGELISMYYELGTDNGERSGFLQKHPEVEAALDFQNERSYLSPAMRDYYTSITKIENYMRGQMWDRVTDVVGEDIFELWDQYYDLKLVDEAAAKSFYKEHEVKFDDYRDLRDGYRRLVAERLISVEGQLRDESIFGVRSDTEDLTKRQQEMMSQITAEDPSRVFYNFTWQDWQGVLSPAQTRLVEDWIYGEELPDGLFDSLGRVAGELGIDDTEQLLAFLQNSYEPSER